MLSGLTAHPAGFEFTLGVALRREDRRDRVFTHGFHHRVEPGEPLPDEFLRVSVGFADGDEFYSARLTTPSASGCRSGRAV